MNVKSHRVTHLPPESTHRLLLPLTVDEVQYDGDKSSQRLAHLGAVNVEYEKLAARHCAGHGTAVTEVKQLRMYGCVADVLPRFGA